ncbi:MAG: sulfotransferase [Candidatus Sulfotelmatobacter sp.]
MDCVEDVLPGKRLVFLVGAPRSGTTWLQLLLSRSPSVATAQETDLFNIFLHPLVGEWNRYRQTGNPMSLTEVLSGEDVRALLRSVSGFVFTKIARSKPSATVVLEKTPNHVSCWREILELWPDAHFIHIIRDPRSVVASLRFASKSWGPQWGSSRISTICARWISDVSQGREIALATPNYQEVIFEELISDGPQVLMRLLSRLGVRSCPDEVRRYVDECAIENLRAGILDNAPFDVARISKFRFRLGSTDSWRVELSRREIALVERMARPLMMELGIEPVTRNKLTSAWAELCRVAEYTRYKVMCWLRSQPQGH